MRRAVVVVISLAAAALLIFASYSLFGSSETELALEDIAVADASTASEGIFTCRVSCEKEGYFVCGCESDVSDGCLYVTFVASANGSKAFKRDEDGYAKIVVQTGEAKIEKVYYRYNGKNTELTLG